MDEDDYHEYLIEMAYTGELAHALGISLRVAESVINLRKNSRWAQELEDKLIETSYKD